MKKSKFKHILFLGALLMMCSTSKITFAATQDIIEDSSQQVISEAGIMVEVQEADPELENYLNQHINLTSNSLYKTSRGVSKPTALWNLKTNGAYSYTVTTQGSTIFTNYKFTYHEGSLRVKATETIGQDAVNKTYTIRLRDGNTDKVVSSAKVNRGETVYVTFMNLDLTTPYYVEFFVAAATKIVDGLIY